MPDYLPKNPKKLKKLCPLGWYRCELEGEDAGLYPEKDMIIHKETGLLVCKNCLILLHELDQEQEDIEEETRRERDELYREEMKVKSGLNDKEGP